MTATLDWAGDRVSDNLRRGVASGLATEGQGLAAIAQRLLGVSAPGRAATGGPPRRRTGTLQRSQTAWVTDAPQGPVLHVGVRTGAPAGRYASIVHSSHPWLDQVRKAEGVAAAVGDALRRAL